MLMTTRQRPTREATGFVPKRVDEAQLADPLSPPCATTGVIIVVTVNAVPPVIPVRRPRLVANVMSCPLRLGTATPQASMWYGGDGMDSGAHREGHKAAKSGRYR
ncbi:hypothetical protein SaccyDRAFT_1657 [Saccharomonospora cyanea NA-134]|uniref:Uncharacterized protein n=1 Tax=Saccharomonospora cyanea NA-134 TaxID=882082 RepID=H5XGL6_9PSEU|nr:hypothetical protein SaccyDRAFT_1657 [Saccharomonospora cyanea NA-134]